MLKRVQVGAMSNITRADRQEVTEGHLDLDPVAADNAAVDHEAQRKQHVAVVGHKRLVALQRVHIDAILQHACARGGASLSQHYDPRFCQLLQDSQEPLYKWILPVRHCSHQQNPNMAHMHSTALGAGDCPSISCFPIFQSAASNTWQACADEVVS